MAEVSLVKMPSGDWIINGLTDDESTSVLVMACCLTAPSRHPALYRHIASLGHNELKLYVHTILDGCTCIPPTLDITKSIRQNTSESCYRRVIVT